MGLSDGRRIALAAAFIAPLALAMGIPFPLALVSISQRAPNLVPWAWGRQRLRFGGGRRTGDAIGDAFGVYRGRARRAGALCAGRTAVSLRSRM